MIRAALRPMRSETHPQISPHSRLNHPMVMNRRPAAPACSEPRDEVLGEERHVNDVRKAEGNVN